MRGNKILIDPLILLNYSLFPLQTKFEWNVCLQEMAVNIYLYLIVISSDSKCYRYTM